MTLRYITLVEMKGWMLDIDPTAVLPNDAEMTKAIARAEATWDKLCGGVRFDQQTYTLVQPFTTLVDGNGWLKLTAAEGGPVTSVASVQTMNVGLGENTWRTITWDAVNGLLMPSVSSPPRPNAWDVLIQPIPPLYSACVGSIYAKWTYTAGYATIPDELKAEIARLAIWVWKLTREAPLGIVKNPMLGLVDIPLSIPPDIKADALLWSRGGS
jgi:hypothetical protein